MNVNKIIKLNLALHKILENQGVDWKKYTKIIAKRKGKKIVGVKLYE